MVQKRSLFGPLLLMAIGTVWLLVKSSSVPVANLWALTHIWPFLLIAAGIGLIVRPYWSYSSIVMDVLIVGGLVLSILYAPQLGWANPSMISLIGDSDLYIGPGEPGSGKVITQTREAFNFHAIEVNYPAKVFVKQGNTESVKIEAEDNLMPNLRTEVKNGALEIFYKKTDDRHINPTKTVIITITVKDLDEVIFASAGELTINNLETNNLAVALNGAGNLQLKDINIKNLGVNLSGAGSMTASGTINALDLNISGFGDFKGADLHGKTAQVNISGAGSASVWMDDELDTNISGAGSVNYFGAPHVTKQINGLGSVSPSGDK